jgi:hypothetical protein
VRGTGGHGLFDITPAATILGKCANSVGVERRCCLFECAAKLVEGDTSGDVDACYLVLDGTGCRIWYEG